MKNGYSINYSTNTLTVTKAFMQKAMENQHSSEYKTITKFKRDFPGLTIITRTAPKRKSAAARLTYDKMIKYLACQKNSEALLLMFNTVKEHSKSQSAPYMYVKKWFLELFPEYTKYPSFDENGNLITQKAPSAPPATAENLNKVGDVA